MKYVEQDGNIFKEVESGKFEYVPKKVEQDGSIFQFNPKTKEYDHIGEMPKEQYKPAPEDFPHALRVGFEQAGSLYTRPTIAGAGGALGAFVGNLQAGKGLKESYQLGKEAFSQARDEAIAEQEDVGRKSPTGKFIGELAGNIVTAPLMPIKSIASALKVSAITGAGQAIGEAQDASDALKMVGANLAAGAGVYGIGKGIGKVVEKTIDKVTPFIPEKILAKIGSTTTGIPEKDIITYAKNVDEINNLIKKTSGNVDVASDEVKAQLQKAIQKTRIDLGNSIGEAIKDAPDYKFIPVDGIVAKLNKVKNTIDKDLEPELVNEIDTYLSKVVKKGADKSDIQGMVGTKFVSIKELNDIKAFLQKNSQDAFIKNGSIFPKDKDVARAAREGYMEAKNIIDSIVPSVKEANQQLHQLHVLESNINKNILATGKPAGAFLSAAAQENIRGRNQLELLGKITGYDVLKDAEKVSAMRSFADTKFLPQGAQTGYSLGRIGVGAGLGAAVAEAGGEDYKTGAVIGAALTGPTALKALINSGNITGKTINQSINMIQNPTVQSVISRQTGTQLTKPDISAIERRLKFYK
jgi:hypothetical protein